MKKDRFLIFNITTVLFLLFFMGFNLNGCSPDKPEQYAGPPKNLRIGLGKYSSDFSGLLFLAEIEGFFKEQGLDITLVRVASGAVAIRAVPQGSVDMGNRDVFAQLKMLLVHFDLGLENMPGTGAKDLTPSKTFSNRRSQGTRSEADCITQ